MAETAIEGILTLDATGIVRYWNPGAERLFGPRADAAVGRPVTFALPEPFLTTQGLAAREATVGTTFETIGRREDGTEFPIELSLATWTNTQGARFFTAIVRDITDRKEAVRALEAKAAELARSNQELQQFAYVASHDLQEPLRMVANYTQLLARRYKDQLDSDANEFIEFAVDGAKRMQDLIHDLLQYARVGTRGKAFRPTPADRILADALANLAGDHRGDAGRGPGRGSARRSCATRRRWRRCSRTSSATPSSSAVRARGPSSGSRPARSDTGWTIAVRDNGIGIAPKYFDRIFQMFQRLHGRGEYPGTGIGLALCRKIVERHGGTMHVASEPDRGTTFSFTHAGRASGRLILRRPHETRRNPARRRQPGRRPPDPRGPRRRARCATTSTTPATAKKPSTSCAGEGPYAAPRRRT